MTAILVIYSLITIFKKVAQSEDWEKESSIWFKTRVIHFILLLGLCSVVDWVFMYQLIRIVIFKQ